MKQKGHANGEKKIDFVAQKNKNRNRATAIALKIIERAIKDDIGLYV